MGRPPIGKQPMSDAERQRRHRAKFRDTKPVTKQAAPESSAEVERLKARIAELEAAAPKAEVRKLIIDLKAENADLKAEIVRLRADLRFGKGPKRHAATPRAEKPPLTPDEARDRRIKALTTENQNLKTRIRYLVAERESGRAGMPRATRIAIDKCLQPDSKPTKEDKDNAAKLWNAYADKLRRPNQA